MLKISNLSARVAGKEILKGVNLTVNAGEVHAVMGPNGSGKSTLAQVLAGREDYEVTGGTVSFEGRDLLAMAPEERARAGLFLGFQYPVEIPGVNNVYLLKAALNAKRKAAGEPEVDAFEFLALIREKMKFMHMSEAFLTRGVNWSRSWPSSMRPIPDWISMRSRWWPTGSTVCATRRAPWCW
jgi:Fe-S cluster assembly ATP-binding protein